MTEHNQSSKCKFKGSKVHVLTLFKRSRRPKRERATFNFQHPGPCRCVSAHGSSLHPALILSVAILQIQICGDDGAKCCSDFDRFLLVHAGVAQLHHHSAAVRGPLLDQFQQERMMLLHLY